MQIQIIPAYSCPEEVRQLFTEYTDHLIAGDPEFLTYLQIQNYDGEIACLEEKYGPPYGQLYLALADGKTAGCIALRKLDEHRCEMKRLYVRDEFRRHGIGRKLVEQHLTDARKIGYRVILLDTLPFLTDAIRLYRRLGFREIPRYNNSPMDSTLYFALEL